ncbi:MAG: SpoIIE family protein phosphatase [Candidatus Rokubacteria bacterium]|nr:SpoIIE family protein phosphatase [Candidatus Rokubacteria bacterium]
MIPQKSSSRAIVHWVAYVLTLTFIAALCVLFVINIVRWQKSPDFGWRIMYNAGPNVVSEVFPLGAKAGLRPGDRILAINGRPYSTFEELFFGNIRQEELGSINTYSVLREGRTEEIRIPTGRLGLETVLWRSTPLFVLGLVYVLIGALVFLMKPKATESWIFFVLTCSIGMTVSLAGPSDLMHPTWLYDVRFLFHMLMPASMIHLALRFPKKRALLTKQPWFAILPYVPTAVLVTLEKTLATAYWNIPKSLLLIWLVYLMVAVLVFLTSTIWNSLKGSSIIVRLQSRVIFVGIMLGLFIPGTDLIIRLLWQVYLFPNPTLGFGVVLTTFPLSIGYTIVKHDLFAIDTIVRRTYGYVLSTGTVVAAYALMVSLLNVTFQGSDVARSPLFSIGFALLVVFLFEPLHRRFQGLVDRLFYRQRYDYRKTIRSLSEAMTSILDPEVISRTLIGSVVKEMFLENGALLLQEGGAGGYQVKVVEGMDARRLPASELQEGDALVGAVKEKKDALLRHDVAMNPLYEPNREELQKAFQSLSSEVVLPMTYKDEVRGILSLGRKKSGKLFTPEDLDLLRTLTNQSAIAMENARLFKENLQKGRMEEELKIAHDIQMSMLPDKAPQLEGLKVVARTIPAREVGGDFYDFVEFSADGSPGRLGIIIADVSGKGVSAGLLMAGARSTYRVLLDADPPVREVMTLANQRLQRDIRKGMFVALLYAVLDPGARTLTLSNAGQTQPVLCAAGAAPSYITTEGDTFPLGIVPDCDYQETKVSLSLGNVVVFYTDGVVEAMNAQEELYGFDRFLRSVEEGRHLDAPSLLDKLFDDVARFVGGTEQHDDITIIVARVE